MLKFCFLVWIEDVVLWLETNPPEAVAWAVAKADYNTWLNSPVGTAPSMVFMAVNNNNKTKQNNSVELEPSLAPLCAQTRYGQTETLHVFLKLAVLSLLFSWLLSQNTPFMVFMVVDNNNKTRQNKSVKLRLGLWLRLTKNKICSEIFYLSWGKIQCVRLVLFKSIIFFLSWNWCCQSFNYIQKSTYDRSFCPM